MITPDKAGSRKDKRIVTPIEDGEVGKIQQFPNYTKEYKEYVEEKYTYLPVEWYKEMLCRDQQQKSLNTLAGRHKEESNYNNRSY